MKHVLIGLGAVLALLPAAVALAQGASAPPPFQAGAPSTLQWGEFERLVKGRFGAEQIDVACEAPFDSANPVAMAAELGMRRGATALVDSLTSLWKSAPVAPAEQRRQENEWLRQTARHKIWLPVSAESVIGDHVHDKASQQGKVLAEDQLPPRDAARLERVRQVVSRLVAALPGDQPYQFRVFVTAERGSSLSTHMGGFLYVSEGLLRDRSLDDADLTLRIAHEISHVTKRHVLRDFQTKLIDAYTLVNQTEQDLKSLTDPSRAIDLVLRRYSLAQTLARTFDHNNELEADSCAVWLAGRVLPPDTLKVAIDRFAAQQAATGERSPDGSVHPRNDLRVQAMRLQLQRVAAHRAAPGPATPAQPAPRAAAAEGAGPGR